MPTLHVYLFPSSKVFLVSYYSLTRCGTQMRSDKWKKLSGCLFWFNWTFHTSNHHYGNTYVHIYTMHRASFIELEFILVYSPSPPYNTLFTDPYDFHTLPYFFLYSGSSFSIWAWYFFTSALWNIPPSSPHLWMICSYNTSTNEKWTRTTTTTTTNKHK